MIYSLYFFTQDLDLTKPAAPKISRDDGFTVTTEEVLRKADFRVSTNGCSFIVVFLLFNLYNN